MIETKWFIKSTGIMAPLISLFVVGSRYLFGIEIAEAEVADAIDKVILAAGAVLAIWGRFRATSQVTVTKPKGDQA